LVVKNKIFGFDVTMDDFMEVHVFEPEEDAGREESGLLFVELVPSADVIAQITSGHQVHDQVECIPVLEGLPHVDNELVLDSPEQLALVTDRLVALLGQDAG
jgi:hypothetical protein